MSTRTLPGGSRRWLTAAGIATLLVVTATGCYGTWGVRESYRAYTQSPYSEGGAITTESGATWLDAAGPAKGPFQWSVANAQLDPTTETGYIQFSGGVKTSAHVRTGGSVMDISFWNPRLELAGDTGTLVVDLNYRPYVGIAPTTLPNLEAALDVDFATVDLSGFDWTAVNDVYTITDAPMTGVPAAMELISWDEFYPTENPVLLDPLSVSFNRVTFAPGLANLPKITVSKTTGLNPGDKIIVHGSGFDPSKTIGTRPPLSGQQSGSYVTFGKFAAAWQPSTGAASSTRTVIDQKWALPQGSFSALNPAGTNPAYVLIDQYGSFETTVTISASASANANYGIYSYPGSGGNSAAHELYVPLTLNP